MRGKALLLLSETLSHESLISSTLSLLLADELLLHATVVTLALKALGRDETLDLRGLRVGLSTLLLRLHRAADDVLAHVIVLCEVEELANVVSTLRTETLRDSALRIRQTRNLLFTLLDHNAVQGLNIRANNAATDTLPAALTVAARTVARVTLTEEQTHTRGQEDTLLHGETLLVVATSNAKDVALPFVTKRVDLNILGHTLIVKAAHETLIQELEGLLRARGRVGNVELHLLSVLEKDCSLL